MTSATQYLSPASPKPAPTGVPGAAHKPPPTKSTKNTPSRKAKQFTSGQNWETAWAVNSSHAADLTFDYTIENAGTEYAREVIGHDLQHLSGRRQLPTISYPAWEQFPGGKLENLFPVGPNTPGGVSSSLTFSSTPIPLSLETMKRIDLGERLTVKVENFSYGADELFYTDAINGGVTVLHRGWRGGRRRERRHLRHPHLGPGERAGCADPLLPGRLRCR